MNLQLLHLLRILLNRRITSTPVRVLRELRTQGKQRLPDKVQKEIEGGLGKNNALSFMKQWLGGEQLSRHNGQWVLNSFLPPFPGPAFDRMFENLLSGRRLSPVSSYLAITGDCPYNCWHCSYKKRKTGELSTEEWISTIEGLQQIGTSIIGFTGGEPLMRKDLPELVAAASTLGIATIVFSSGFFLDKHIAVKLRNAGLWAFCVSLDHPDPEKCDSLRGKDGAYEKAIQALKISREAGFYTMTGTVATKELVSCKLYEKIYEQAREVGVHEFRLIEPMPCGRLNDLADNVFLSSEETRDLRQFHIQTNRKGKLPKVCSFNQIESPEIFGCGAGTQHLYIDSAGEVCPCDFIPLSFGSVLTESVSNLWGRMNEAMENLRRHCFIQKNHKLITKHSQSQYPLAYDVSKRICKEAGTEPLPDYFALVTGQRGDR